MKTETQVFGNRQTLLLKFNYFIIVFDHQMDSKTFIYKQYKK